MEFIFPGCTLQTKAKDLDRYASGIAPKRSASSFARLENWQCCGGGLSAWQTTRSRRKLSSVRALGRRAREDRPLVTVCSACHNVIKQTERRR